MSSSALTSSRSLQISLGSTPVKKKSGSTPSNAPRLGHRDIKEAMARELEDEIVGGMPVREFFSQFLAVDEQHLPAVLSSISDTYFDGVPSRSKSVAEAKAKEEEKTSFVEDDLEDDPEEEEEILPSGIPEPPPVTAEEKEKRKQRRVKEKDMYAKLASLQVAVYILLLKRSQFTRLLLYESPRSWATNWTPLTRLVAPIKTRKRTGNPIYLSMKRMLFVDTKSRKRKPAARVQHLKL